MAGKKSKQVPFRVTEHGFVSCDVTEPDTPDYVVAELRYEAPVALGARAFAAPAAASAEARGLNDILGHFDIKSVKSQFGLSHAEVGERVALAAALPSEPSAKALKAKGADEAFRESGFIQIVPRKDGDAAKLAKALEGHDSVWQAYVAPRPVPAGLSGSAVGSRLFEPAQGYLHASPNGIGAMEVWSLPGGKGAKVTICDIEGAWNTKHEDLPKGISLIGGTMIADLGWRNHGTAVLGEMVSRPDTKGAVGISHEAKAVVHSAVIGGVFNTAAAITGAAAALKAGDVILIELHAPAPGHNYVAMQYWSDIFLAIQAAVAKGVTVVEAAGNGNENFEHPDFVGTGLQKDSGAILVGAGVPPTNHVDFDGFGAALPGYSSLGVPRSRIWFSNYGKMVNVQAWGWHVTTLAYGDAQGDASENKWYTHRFSGTSSASPIVTGSVACLQGRAIAKNGAPLTPAQVRSILVKTGVPQVAGPGVPVTQKIGPQPNLPKALAVV